MECLDELTVVALAEGRLSGERVEAIEQHVDGCPECRELLAALARVASSRSDVLGPLAPGERCGRYLILSRVGAGGMGEVYAAWDPELDRKVAIKLLHDDDPEVGDSSLLREARAMARLAHPNVLAVHDVGTLDGRVFLTTEFVDALEATRAYEANIGVLEITKDLTNRSLQIVA